MKCRCFLVEELRTVILFEESTLQKCILDIYWSNYCIVEYGALAVVDGALISSVTPLALFVEFISNFARLQIAGGD